MPGGRAELKKIQLLFLGIIMKSGHRVYFKLKLKQKKLKSLTQSHCSIQCFILNTEARKILIKSYCFISNYTKKK